MTDNQVFSIHKSGILAVGDLQQRDGYWWAIIFGRSKDGTFRKGRRFESEEEAKNWIQQKIRQIVCLLGLSTGTVQESKMNYRQKRAVRRAVKRAVRQVQTKVLSYALREEIADWMSNQQHRRGKEDLVLEAMRKWGISRDDAEAIHYSVVR